MADLLTAVFNATPNQAQELIRSIQRFTGTIFISKIMGVKRTWRCENCNYSVVISAGRDSGFSITTNTFVCKACHSLLDLVVESKMTNSGKVIEVKKGQTCRKCTAENFVVWDSVRKECPKCTGT